MPVAHRARKGLGSFLPSMGGLPMGAVRCECSSAGHGGVGQAERGQLREEVVLQLDAVGACTTRTAQRLERCTVHCTHWERCTLCAALVGALALRADEDGEDRAHARALERVGPLLEVEREPGLEQAVVAPVCAARGPRSLRCAAGVPGICATALCAAGICVPWDLICRVCGSCAALRVRGEPLHLPERLDREERHEDGRAAQTLHEAVAPPATTHGGGVA